MNQPHMIVIDDERGLVSIVTEVAEQLGFNVEAFTDSRLFLLQYPLHADIILLDLMMPGVDGIEIIRFLAQNKCDAQIILMSGFDSGVLHSAQKLAMEQGLNFAGSLNKPFRTKELLHLLKELSITPKTTPQAVIRKPPTVDELRYALSHDELIIYYQPKIGLHNIGLNATEALVRWQNPIHGLFGPDLFISTAEQNGLINELTWIVLEKVMAQCQTWNKQGLAMRVAVNMSVETLKDLDVPEKMHALARKYQLQPEQIILEVTETALMQELTTSLDILTRLRMKGFHLSIDDFGTGYSSLVQLYRVPFTEIKIDCSFIMEMKNDPEAATIVETIILLGHKLNMKIVAEGVETESCRQVLTDLSCDSAQGYLFSRPMPSENVLDWYAEHRELHIA